MKDANLKVTAAMPNAGNTVASGIIDLGIEPTSGGWPSSKWRTAYLEVTTPNMPNATNTSASVTITLQCSGDNATTNMANTSPVISVPIAGIANGPNSATYKLPIPPTCKRYIRTNTVATANFTSDYANMTVEVVV